MVKSVGVGDPIWVVVEKKELQPPHSIVKSAVKSVGMSLKPGPGSGDRYFSIGTAEIEVHGADVWIENIFHIDNGEYVRGLAFFTRRQDAEDFRDKQKV